MERDFPIGHPAASDYKGEAYKDPFASYMYDFPEGHPARAGKNRSELDTPDGVREAHLRQTTPLADLAKQGSLPPMFRAGAAEPLPLPAEQLAEIYAARQVADFEHQPTAADAQALTYIMRLGFTAEEASELYKSYAQPPKPAASAT